MHVLNFKSYYAPEKAAGIALDKDTAEDLAKRGHTVHLWVPTPSRGVSQQDIDATPRVETSIDGRLIVKRYHMFKEKNSIAQKLIRYIFCSFVQVGKGLREKEIDLVFVGSTPPFQGLIAVLIKKLRKVPFVYNLQDIFPDSMVSAGMTSEDSIVCRIGNVVSNCIYKNANHIILISAAMKENLVRKGVDPSKISIVHNWIDVTREHPVPKEKNKLFDELGIPQYDFTVVYAGNLGFAQSVDIIVEAALRLKDEQGLGFVIFGNGALEDDLKQKVAESGLSNIIIKPLQPYERVSEVYSLGDACVVSCKRGTGANAVPSKTWSIMAAGRAVLASFDKDTLIEEIVSDAGCGLFSEADDAVAFANNILKLKSNAELCSQMGIASRKYIEDNLSREVCTKKICDIIETAFAKSIATDHSDTKG